MYDSENHPIIYNTFLLTHGTACACVIRQTPEAIGLPDLSAIIHQWSEFKGFRWPQNLT
jgi:hypothetical protein